MTRLQRWMRRFAEKLGGTYYEGPDALARLAEQVVAFASAHPDATRGEWARYATALARSSYQAGYTRGLEWTERDLDRLPPEAVEVAAHHAAHDFEWHAPEALTEGELASRVGGDFLDDLPDDKARAVVLDVVGRHHGGFRVVLLPQVRR